MPASRPISSPIGHAVNSPVADAAAAAASLVPSQQLLILKLAPLLPLSGLEIASRIGFTFVSISHLGSEPRFPCESY